MAYLTRKARKMLDEAGWTECKISVSNSLDEYLIQDLLLQGAQIDLFGVGERHDHRQVRAGVRRRVQAGGRRGRPDGTIIPKIKVSENVEKITIPHFKKVYRLLRHGTPARPSPTISRVYDETVDDTQGPGASLTPWPPGSERTCITSTARELLVPIFQNGKRVYDCPPLPEIQAYCRPAGGHPVGRGQAL